jgi:hypothetical protein
MTKLQCGQCGCVVEGAGRVHACGNFACCCRSIPLLADLRLPLRRRPGVLASWRESVEPSPKVIMGSADDTVP